MQYKTVKVVRKSTGFLSLETWEDATTRTITENIQDGWRFVSSFGTTLVSEGVPFVYLIFEKG